MDHAPFVTVSRAVAAACPNKEIGMWALRIVGESVCFHDGITIRGNMQRVSWINFNFDLLEECKWRGG
jgi:hypothetical protein